jgi:nickel transport protein
VIAIARPLAALAVLAAALAAEAHEVRHEVVRGRAVAVRAVYAGGDPVAYAEYQVFAPSDPRVPHQKGRTDRAGWLAFVPSERGSWRVQVADATGHGLVVEVPAGPGDAPAEGEGAITRAPHGPGRVARAVAGAAAIVAAFALLYVARSRRSS